SDFIYHYHGSSDIRLPNIYGATPSLGIGPCCGGRDEFKTKEWLSRADYIDGIKIAASMIIDWCL
ncbi:MAG: hypothetical protein RR332_05725, partial [Clostridiales bacterium]